jgi:thymidylate synthase (FAD)
MTHGTTKRGVRYVTQPNVALACRPHPRTLQLLSAMADEHGEFLHALEDFETNGSDGPEEYLQFAGQLCYMALAKNRTPFAENEKYLKNIMAQAHGSVLEHINYGFLILGIDRATTHELVRHRTGMAYSQVSQRYVDSDHLRFVCPVEDQTSPEALEDFEADIDINYDQYVRRIDKLMTRIPRAKGESAQDYRKRIQGSARSVLGNYVEAPILTTGNVRAWRHVLEMRCSPHADVRIRRPMMQILCIMREECPTLFGDFEISGDTAVPTYHKV